MFGFIGWMIIGLIAGGLARLLVPGRQPMGLLMTMGLGLMGSILGGFISSVVFNYDPNQVGFHAGGFFMSTVGAVVLLMIYLRFSRPETSING